MTSSRIPVALFLAAMLVTSSCYESVRTDEEGNVLEKTEDGEESDEAGRRDSDTTSAQGTDPMEDSDSRFHTPGDTEETIGNNGLDCVSINAGLCDAILCDFQEVWDEYAEECRLSESECEDTLVCFASTMQCFLYACPPGSSMDQGQVDMLNECLRECFGGVDTYR